MLDWDLMDAFPHGDRAGLQLSDFVGSAFYQAIDTGGQTKWNLEPASALAPIMAREKGSAKNFGVSLWPTQWWKADLTDEQKQIFRHYGYKL